MRIKKRSDGKYDLGENVRVPGKKTPRFKAILHLGKNPTIDAAIEAQRRDRCDPRRTGESQIEAESRRARAKLIIDRLQTMKLRAEDEARALAYKLAHKVIMQKVDARMPALEKQACKRLERQEQEEKERVTRAQAQQYAAQVEQASRKLQPRLSPEDARYKSSLTRGRTRIMRLMERTKRRALLIRCNHALASVNSTLRAKFPALRDPS